MRRSDVESSERFGWASSANENIESKVATQITPLDEHYVLNESLNLTSPRSTQSSRP